MSWRKPRPHEGESSSERLRYMQEIYDRFVLGTASVTTGSVGANGTVDVVLSLGVGSGILPAQEVHMSPQAVLTAGLIYGGAVASNKDEITLRLANVTAAPIATTTTTWTYAGMVK